MFNGTFKPFDISLDLKYEKNINTLLHAWLEEMFVGLIEIK